MDFSRGTPSDQVVIYAVDRTAAQQDAPDPGEVKVTAIHLGGSTAVDSFLQEAFKQVSVRLMSSTWHHKNIVVSDTIG